MEGENRGESARRSGSGSNSNNSNDWSQTLLSANNNNESYGRPPIPTRNSTTSAILVRRVGIPARPSSSVNSANSATIGRGSGEDDDDDGQSNRQRMRSPTPPRSEGRSHHHQLQLHRFFAHRNEVEEQTQDPRTCPVTLTGNAISDPAEDTASVQQLVNAISDPAEEDTASVQQLVNAISDPAEEDTASVHQLVNAISDPAEDTASVHQIVNAISDPAEDTASVQQLVHPETSNANEENNIHDPSPSHFAVTASGLTLSQRQDRHPGPPMEEGVDENPTETRMAAIIRMDDDDFSSGTSIHVNLMAMQRLPRIDISEQHLRNNSECVICTDRFQLTDEVREMECRHMFHEHCLFPWLNRNATCPICRGAIPPPG